MRVSKEGTDPLHTILLVFFSIFVAATTFSIALAQITFGLSLALFIFIAIRDRYIPIIPGIKWFYIFVGGYIGWLVISAIAGATPLQSLSMIKEEWLFLIIPIGIYLSQQEKNRQLFVTLFAVSIGLFSLYALSQFFTGTAWLHFSQNHFSPIPITEIQGNFNNSMTFGNCYITAGCFLLTLSFFSNDKWTIHRWLFLASGLLAFTAVFLSFRRGAIASAVITLILIAMSRKSKFRWPVIGISVLVAVVLVTLPQFRIGIGSNVSKDLSSSYEGSRIYIWNHSVEVIKENPFWGVGQGNFQNAYANTLPADVPAFRRYTHAHNDFLNVAAIGGIPCALIFLGMWLAVLYYLWHGSRRPHLPSSAQVLSLAAFAGSLAFLLTSLTEATFADEEVRELLMFIWAIGLSVWYNPCENRAASPGTQTT